jgi:signal transduction histidine kinase
MVSVALLRILKPLTLPCLLVRASGEVLAANAAASSMLGPSANVGAQLSDAVADGNALRSYLAACSRTNEAIPGAIKLRNGPRLRCHGALVEAGERPVLLLRLQEGESAATEFHALNSRIEALNREVRERRRAEDRLQHQAMQLEELTVELEQTVEALQQQTEEAVRAHEAAQHANSAKSEFLATMSHELRTPLNAVVGYADLLDAGVAGDLNDEQRSQLSRIRSSADHLRGIIDEILLFARIEAGKERLQYAEVELSALLRGVSELMQPAAAAKGLPLIIDAADDVVITTDPARLRQILLNLVSNAVKFADAGAITIRQEVHGEGVRIAVVDAGVGIEAEHLDSIFEPFWQVDRGPTREAGGTGLGLTVTQRLARLLGGDISVCSVPGEGSTFTVRLPLRPPSVQGGDK